MTTTTAMTTTTPVPAKTAESIALLSKKGQVVGARKFFGTLPASEIRKVGKELGMKGSTLDAYVTKGLMDDAANRVIMGVAWVQAQAQEGYLPDYGDSRSNRKGGGTGCLRTVKPVPAPVKQTVAEARAAALALLGMTEADMAARVAA